MSTAIDITLVKGKTFEFALRYASGRLVSREIEAVPSLVPVRLTVTGHGLPDGWPFTVTCVKRPHELNGEYTATVIDEDTIEINDLVGQCWRQSWSGGGVVQYPAPADITGWSARAMFRRHLRDPGADGLFVVDPAESTFTLQLEAEVSELLPTTAGVWDAEAIDPEGRVFPLVGVSAFCIEEEVTR